MAAAGPEFGDRCSISGLPWSHACSPWPMCPSPGSNRRPADHESQLHRGACMTRDRGSGSPAPRLCLEQEPSGLALGV